MRITPAEFASPERPAWWRPQHGNWIDYRGRCDGFVDVVRDAANPETSLHMPYSVRSRIFVAVELARIRVKDARARGLYPLTAHLDAEARAAA